MEKQWFRESTLNHSAQSSFAIEKKIFEKQSAFQSIKVYETRALGRLLTLDDSAMICDKDEFIYHEVMVHTPYLIQEQTKKVLIIGGGDGGIVRELLKYESIEHIDLVEIDKEVIDVAREYFPHVALGLTNEKVHIHFEDGLNFLKKQKDKNHLYDIIVVDSTDPVGLAKDLYSQHFFEMISNTLSEEGIFMSQTGTPFFDEFNIKKNYDDLQKHFPIVKAICAPILIYPGVYWTFAMASKKWNEKDFKEHKLSEYEHFSKTLKWHNKEWQKSSTTLSNLYRKCIFGED